MNKRLKILFLLLVFSMPMHAVDLKDRLRNDVAFMCDSLSSGRAMGTAGSQNVAMYLLRHFRDLGLRAGVQSFEAAGKVGHNIYAITPGWFREYVLVTAYYDGLGNLGGDVYHGADSNASGVAALLELSRTLPEKATGQVGIIFVALDGHNASMSGASAFLKGFSKDYRLRLMVNMDIIGSSLAPLHKDRPDYLMALGGSRFRLQMEGCNRKAGLDLAFDYYGSSAFTDLFYRKISDQRVFLEQGIPAVMFTSGITSNTNKTTDLPDSLDYPVYARRVVFISSWLETYLSGTEIFANFAIH